MDFYDIMLQAAPEQVDQLCMVAPQFARVCFQERFWLAKAAQDFAQFYEEQDREIFGKARNLYRIYRYVAKYLTPNASSIQIKHLFDDLFNNPANTVHQIRQVTGWMLLYFTKAALFELELHSEYGSYLIRFDLVDVIDFAVKQGYRPGPTILNLLWTKDWFISEIVRNNPKILEYMILLNPNKLVAHIPQYPWLLQALLDLEVGKELIFAGLLHNPQIKSHQLTDVLSWLDL